MVTESRCAQLRPVDSKPYPGIEADRRPLDSRLKTPATRRSCGCFVFGVMASKKARRTPESVGKFVALVFSVIVSEPRAVAIGSCDTLENFRGATKIRLDPVATARGSDTS
jgi:hypothetical protein